MRKERSVKKRRAKKRRAKRSGKKRGGKKRSVKERNGRLEPVTKREQVIDRSSSHKKRAFQCLFCLRL